jgi:hypothetical protein
VKYSVYDAIRYVSKVAAADDEFVYETGIKRPGEENNQTDRILFYIRVRRPPTGVDCDPPELRDKEGRCQAIFEFVDQDAICLDIPDWNKSAHSCIDNRIQDAICSIRIIDKEAREKAGVA